LSPSSHGSPTHDWPIAGNGNTPFEGEQGGEQRTNCLTSVQLVRLGCCGRTDIVCAAQPSVAA
jgi:hypothetical protein